MLPNGDLVTSKHRLRQADLGDARQYASKKRNRRLTDNVLSLDTLVAFKQRAPTGRLGGVQTGKVLPTGELTASNPDMGATKERTGGFHSKRGASNGRHVG